MVEPRTGRLSKQVDADESPSGAYGEVLAVFAPSEMHPDEWSQGTPFVINHLFPAQYESPFPLTWENLPPHHLRSNPIAFLQLGPPLLLARGLYALTWRWTSWGLGTWVFVSIRAWCAIWMGWSVWKAGDIGAKGIEMVLSDEGPTVVERKKGGMGPGRPFWKRWKPTTYQKLFATSWITLTFGCRQFSNTLELLATMELLRRVLAVDRRRQEPSLTTTVQLSLLACLAIFARVSFIFSLPIPGILYFKTIIAAPRISQTTMTTHIIKHSFTALIAFLSLSLLIVSIDSELATNSYRPTIISPLRLLRWNATPGNVEQFGVGPRWMHAVVSMPVLFGPLYGVWLWELGRKGWGLRRGGRGGAECRAVIKDKVAEREETRFWMMSIGVMIILAAHSLNPHQEPRFLLPILPFMIFSLPPSIFNRRSMGLRGNRRIKFWHLWLLHNLVLFTFLGFFMDSMNHPVTMKVDDIIRRNEWSGRIGRQEGGHTILQGRAGRKALCSLETIILSQRACAGDVA